MIGILNKRRTNSACLLRKDLVVGLGEIGTPILKLISKRFTAAGYDINPKLMDLQKYEKLKANPTVFAHICIPFSDKFERSVIDIANTQKPQAVIIHSTVSPYTTEKLQKKLHIPVIYSATRGIHKRMSKDLKRYTKFYSVYRWAPRSKWASKTYENLMKKCGVKTKKMSNPLTLELAKIICDTSYYGWLINYAQLSNLIAIKNKVDYDEMWSFADEIHKYLGNRPKMFPGFIGGHCLIPNLDLIKDDTLNLIKEINSDYAKILKKRQVQGKKY